MAMLKNSNGVIKKCKVGFSWTVFFFGILVPLFRGDIKGFFKMWLLCAVTFCLYIFYAMFKYNKQYIEHLLETGYEPIDAENKQILVNANIIAG